MDLARQNRFFSLVFFHLLPGTVRLAVACSMVACIALFSYGWCAEEPGSGLVQVSEGDVFSRISFSVKKVHTMSSAFEQERRTAMLKDAMMGVNQSCW
jgi:hypothetical protein